MGNRGLCVLVTCMVLLTVVVSPARGQFTERPDSLEALRSETLEQSIANLCEARSYGGALPFGAWGGKGQQIPVPSSAEIIHVHTFINTRRFLKVHQELARLPKDHAAQLVTRGILSSLQQYGREFDEVLAKWIEKTGESEGLRQGHPRSGPLWGRRNQLFALVLLAGSLELPGAAAAVDRATALAIEQRFRRLDGHEALTERERAGWLYNVSLFNRQILATGFVGTEPDVEEARRRAHVLGVGFCCLDLTMYDAQRTVRTYCRETPVDAADFASGSQAFTFCGALDTSQFLSLIADPWTGRSRYKSQGANE